MEQICNKMERLRNNLEQKCNKMEQKREKIYFKWYIIVIVKN